MREGLSERAWRELARTAVWNVIGDACRQDRQKLREPLTNPRTPSQEFYRDSKDAGTYFLDTLQSISEALARRAGIDLGHVTVEHSYKSNGRDRRGTCIYSSVYKSPDGLELATVHVAPTTFPEGTYRETGVIIPGGWGGPDDSPMNYVLGIEVQWINAGVLIPGSPEVLHRLNGDEVVTLLRELHQQTLEDCRVPARHISPAQAA